MVIFAGSLAAFFVMRKRKMGRGSGGGGGRGDGGAYESLADDEEVAMGLLRDGSSRRGQAKSRAEPRSCTMPLPKAPTSRTTKTLIEAPALKRIVDCSVVDVASAMNLTATISTSMMRTVTKGSRSTTRRRR